MTQVKRTDASELLAGRYRLDGLIGRGGMAEVYRATDVRLARLVAVKVLLDSHAGSDRDRFVAEARTLARLSHSGLVTVFDAGLGVAVCPGDPRHAASQQGPDRLFLVMELVEGPTLASLIARAPLTPDHAGAVGAQVAEALAYVHGRGIVHRDVKPGNVLCGPGQEVKLADFGIARLLDQVAHHTRTGHAVGTAAYIAPEQVRGVPVTGAADVYALGLVLLEAITGRREYEGTAVEASAARLHRPPEIPPTMPAAWRELLSEMTASEADRRPPADVVARRLRDGLSAPAPVATAALPDPVTAPILAATEGAPPPPPPPPPAAPSPRTSAIDRAGDGLARAARRGAGWVGAQPTHVRGATIALLGIVLVLVVIALASGGGAPPEIPANTPPELEQPLRDLHVAVNGEDG